MNVLNRLKIELWEYGAFEFLYVMFTFHSAAR